MISFGYVLQASPSSGSGSGSISRIGTSTGLPQYLGFGLLTPFRRDEKSDFASGGGADLVKSGVRQVLNTDASGGLNQGELWWRPEFGSLLYRLRFAPLDETTAQLARVYVIDALRRWEPRVVVKEVTVSEKASVPGGVLDTRIIKLRYDVITSTTPGNQVFLRNQELEVSL